MDKNQSSTPNHPSRSTDTFDLNLKVLSTQPLSNSKTIKIKKTDENLLEFHTIKYLKEQNENLREYSVRLIEKASKEKKIMKNILMQYTKKQEALDEQEKTYEEVWIESIDRVFEMKMAIEGLRDRLTELGEQRAIREILGEDSDIDDDLIEE